MSVLIDVLLFLVWIETQAFQITAGDTTFGRVKYVGDERLVGGVPTVPNKYPFMVHLKIYTKEGGTAICGGSLLNSQYVVTAAHCLKRKSGEEIQSILAVLGHHNIEKKFETWTQSIEVQKWFYNHYDHKRMSNDVALLKLKTPAIFSVGVKPICLPPVGHYFKKGLVKALGWGVIDDKTMQISDELREADLDILDDSHCQKIYKDWFKTDTMMCAGYLDGSKDTCVGDSGGPVFVNDNNNVPTLIGLTSYANKGCGQAGLLAVYTRLSSFSKWIVGKAAPGGSICFGNFK